MVLVDTSVWVQHFRSGEPRLAVLLEDAQVLMHPFVLGEIACGNLKNRANLLKDLRALPVALAAESEEVLTLIERRALSGRGIGWTDAHLIAAALLTNCHLWTIDACLHRAAVSAGVKTVGKRTTA